MIETKSQHESNQAENIFKQVFNSVGIGIISLDSKHSISMVNSQVLKIFGYEQGELENNNINFLFNSKEHDQLRDCLLSSSDKKNKSAQPPYELTGIHKDNSMFPVELTIANNSVHTQCTYTLVLRDISEAKKAEENLKYQAYFDQLTKMPNRTLFGDRAETALNQAKRANEGLAIIYIDLDEFKAVNDRFGHKAGDDMLKIISKRLINSARKTDTVSRRGGDEFTILMPRINQIEDASKLAERILHSNQKPIQFKEELIYPKTSIGISVFPQDGDTIDILLQNADKAMYIAKGAGKNQFVFYQTDV